MSTTGGGAASTGSTGSGSTGSGSTGSGSTGSASTGSASTGSAGTPRRDPRRFFLAFGLVALLIAGVLSYLAYPEPDGLDTVTLDGCEVSEVDGAEELSGECIAQRAQDHDLADGPFADYTVGGNEGLLGLSGVVGVLVTLLLAGGLFWLLRPRRGAGPAPRDPAPPSGP